DAAALERPQGDPEVVGPCAVLEAYARRQHVERARGNAHVPGEPARDGEADVGVAGPSLPVAEAEVVETLAAASACPASHVDLDPDLRAGPKSGHAVTDVHDLARELVTGDVRERRPRETALEDLAVGGADHRGGDPDEHVPRRRARHIDRPDTE